jgi:hypothetical protein
MQMAAGQTHQTQGATGVDPRPALMQLNHQLTEKRISQSAFDSRQAELLKGWTKQQLYFLRRQKYISAADYKRLRPRAPIFAVRV